MLIIDLLLVHRTAHVISIKEAAIESAIWISIGLAFGLIIILWQGGQAGGEYYAGFLIEKSLSVDNVFVWAVIFSFFAVPREYQFRVLFWGIFGALVLRAIFIFAGVGADRALRVDPLRLRGLPAVHGRQDRPPRRDQASSTTTATWPCGWSGGWSRRRTSSTARSCSPSRTPSGVATPLFAVLVLIEATDVVFAVDSVPAILAVSREPFIVFASNAFAILGLRSLYFLLGGMQGKFRYLNIGLGVILAFVGDQDAADRQSRSRCTCRRTCRCGVIALVLTVAIVASLRADKRDHARGLIAPPDREERAEH